MQPYPLALEPIYQEKIWGGRRLERFGRRLPGGPDTRIGESWEVADLAATTPSGGGGAAARSRVSNGPLAGRTLADLIREDPAAILGDAAPSEEGGFPLLVKYLDARENLSVQVHPSSEFAARYPQAHLKSEAWYVVAADPGARIYKGLRAGATREALMRAVERGTVEELLIAVPASPGSVHYLPSGTCHALGAGVLVAEVQTPSDTTFRVWDWGREGRALHLEEALECMAYEPLDARAFEPGTTVHQDGAEVRHLVRCPHFAMDEWRIESGDGLVVDMAGRPEVWMVVAGELTLRSMGGAQLAVSAGAGSTLVLPADLGRTRVRVIEPVTLLRVAIPAG